MGVNEAKTAILENRTALGIEFGSTRIKAVLVDDKNQPIASGAYEWENQYVDGIWTVSYTHLDVYKRQIVTTAIRQTVISILYCIQLKQRVDFCK